MPRLVHVWYRGLLLLYPPAFRLRFGAEMLRVLTEQELDASTLSRRERWRCRCHATWDLVRVGIRERGAATSGLVTRAIGLVLIAAAAMQVIYDLETPELSMGVPAWALTLAVCSLGVALTASTARNDRKRYG